jgi:FAD/FMN-containing dehydrogenase/Fe-S oxidoreductase
MPPTPTDTNTTTSGQVFLGNSPAALSQRLIYATDASVYQELPLGVVIPQTIADLQNALKLAIQQGSTILPRAGGTSLAGQVVGSGIVVDIGPHFNQILELNQAQGWVRVQPGVIRNDLNAYLRPHGLLFGPETSTASRAMIGGMIGNNSSGLHSIVWGDTRSKVLELKAILADSSQITIKAINKAQFNTICQKNTLEGHIYRSIAQILNSAANQKAITEGFPKPEITRRNTGYALDALLLDWQNMQAGGHFNLCKLIAGSEGTLCLITEAKLQLLPVPPPQIVLVNVQCTSFHEATLANLIALKHQPYASEFLDELSITLTQGSTEQSQNRDWVVGNPKAVLMVEFFGHTTQEVTDKASALIAELQAAKLGYQYVNLYNQDTNKAWELRKASLGILSNQKGDTGPVNLIEDVAVTPADLPAYIAEIEALLQKYKLQYSIAAHAGAGELHVCPMMDVRTQAGKALFRQIAEETVPIIKKYRGSLSGEHGDGRLRGEFIPAVMGQANYQLFQQIKQIFDPQGIFNRGKITDTPAMDTAMRVQREQPLKPAPTLFDFSDSQDILRLAEKCSGSGDCRKTEITGGTMCPSFMATRQEKDSTRARANMLRHYYTVASNPAEAATIQNIDTATLQSTTKQVLDLCLSCKGCKSECPSSVDVGKMKAEFTQTYHNQHGSSLRSWLVGHFSKLMRLASVAPQLYNFIYTRPALRRLANRMVGFHPQRTMPLLAPQTLKAWHLARQKSGKALLSKQQLLLFADEFTNYNDVPVGQAAILLLEKLGYQVTIPHHHESARSFLSKGFVKKAQTIANQNIILLSSQVSAHTPIIGLEPSAILSFRDEYPDLASPANKAAAAHLAQHSYLLEEWLATQLDAKKINRSLFSTQPRLIKLHGHCHQKALSNIATAKKALSIPTNYQVQLIPSGCCGMAGSFGYEAEHYTLSQQIGELVLFPTVRQQPSNVIIAAAGTSCRHQIHDATQRTALHPAQILYQALL